MASPAIPGIPGTSALSMAAEAGIRLLVDGDRLRWEAAETPSPEILAELRAAKPALLALLRGEVCVRCGGPLAWAEPGAVAFADGTGAHLPCYERDGHRQ